MLGDCHLKEMRSLALSGVWLVGFLKLVSNGASVLRLPTLSSVLMVFMLETRNF